MTRLTRFICYVPSQLKMILATPSTFLATNVLYEPNRFIGVAMRGKYVSELQAGCEARSILNCGSCIDPYVDSPTWNVLVQGHSRRGVPIEFPFVLQVLC